MSQKEKEEVVDSKKIVGVEIPDTLHEYLLLCAFYLDTTKSQIMRTALNTYRQQNRQRNDIMDGIKTDIQIKWDKIKTQTPEKELNSAFSEFLAEERKAIEKFGFSEDMVDRLVDIQL
jgi:hypothetical protein